MKSFQKQSFFWSLFSHVRTEYEKMRTRKNSAFGHFSHSVTETQIKDFIFVKIFWSKSSRSKCSVKKVFLKISQNSHENTYARDSFLIKLKPSAPQRYLQKTLVQVFSCEFCEISRNTFFYRTPQVAASVSIIIAFEWLPVDLQILGECSVSLLLI